MGWISSFAAAVVAGLALLGSSAAAAQPRVTVIGDSVLTAVEWNATPLALFERGLDLQMDIGVCRTLEGVSCPFEGHTVPTLLDVVNSLGPRLGRTVLIEAGYNEPPAEFAQHVEDSVHALLAAGVTRILWVNLREWQQQYVGMNQTLDAAAARHPELTILDWEPDLPRSLFMVPGGRDPSRVRRRGRDGDLLERLDQEGARAAPLDLDHRAAGCPCRPAVRHAPHRRGWNRA